MKNNNYFLTFTLSLALVAMMLPASVRAQQTDFFFTGMEGFDMRIAEPIISSGLENQIFGQAPVGSGLLIMVAAGAGYALVRRKRHNRKGTALMLALAMLLGMTQCKKNVETITPNIDNNNARITLHMENSSRHVVNPNTGEVGFEAYIDFVLVGNNGKYVGRLDYDGTNFVGDLESTYLTEGEYLYFYFIGGMAIAGLNPGDVSWDLNISDQSSELPVLSCGRSNVVYSSEINSYSSTMLNKCALVNFHFREDVGQVNLPGMLVSATVDFANNTIVPTEGAATGTMKLRGVSAKDKWAILLPLAEGITTTVTISGKNYAVDVPAIEANDYLCYANGNAVVIGHEFSVSASKKVVFSPGNLQYKSGEGWKFADNQYDYIGLRNPSDRVDLFGYGSWTGSDPDPLNMSPSYSQYQWDDADFVQELTNNSETGWFTPSREEWYYIFNNRNNAASKQGAATVHGKHGIILLPDKWLGDAINSNLSGWNDNTPTDVQWAAMEANGAAFLPASGYNVDEYWVDAQSTLGVYWSSTLLPNNMQTYGLAFIKHDTGFEIHPCDGNNTFLNLNQLPYGQAVRLVR